MVTSSDAQNNIKVQNFKFKSVHPMSPRGGGMGGINDISHNILEDENC